MRAGFARDEVVDEAGEALVIVREDLEGCSAVGHCLECSCE